jgi:drug/metabolite transporter (DMT)-like permease
VPAWGAVGYGGAVLVQNAGITRTSVSHAALLVGATPVLVALLAAARKRRLGPPAAWTGFAVSFAGVTLVAAGGGEGATLPGDGLVLASLGVSAAFVVAQPGLLEGRDPVAVSAVQFLAAAVVALPVAVLTEGPPPPLAGAARAPPWRPPPAWPSWAPWAPTPCSPTARPGSRPRPPAPS